MRAEGALECGSLLPLWDSLAPNRVARKAGASSRPARRICSKARALQSAFGAKEEALVRSVIWDDGKNGSNGGMAISYVMQTLWHHAPPHRFVPGGVYMVTAGTLYKLPFFRGDERLIFLQDTLLSTLDKNNWIIQAWAVFVNHYHFIALAGESGTPLGTLLKELHSVTSIEVNRLDQVIDRQVWFQYWDTGLTYNKSWMARLSYVNNNAVHHGLVRVATAYPYCSATWFEQRTSSAFRRKVSSFKYDKIKIVDDF